MTSNIADIVSCALIKKLWVESSRKAHKRSHSIGLSEIGHCLKQLGYKLYSRAVPQPWGYRQYITLSDGVFGHTQLRKLLTKALEGTGIELIEQEREVRLVSPKTSKVFTGHIDGKLKYLDNSTPSVLLEVKVLGDYLYKQFVAGHIPQDYLYQVNAYMQALGLGEALFLVKNKASGDFLTVSVVKDPILVVQIFDRLDFISSTSDINVLPKEYGPSQKGTLPFECTYCPFIKECWKDYNLSASSTSAGKIIYTVDNDTIKEP